MKKIHKILCIHITLRNNIKHIRIKFYRILRIKNLQNIMYRKFVKYYVSKICELITFQKFAKYYVSKICKLLCIENLRKFLKIYDILRFT